MNRPVVGTISVLALLGAGVYLAFLTKDRAQDQPLQSYEGAAARAAIQSTLDFALPPAAQEVRCSTETVERTQLVFARFDVPTIELVDLFAVNARFPALSELKPDPNLVQAMDANASTTRPWWQVAQLPSPTAAQKSGQRNVPPAALKWRVQVATGQIASGATRVYVAFSEEPVTDEKK